MGRLRSQSKCRKRELPGAAQSGAKNEGVVKFYKISDSITRIVLQMDYGPKGIIEEIGDALGLVKMRTSGDLKRFKEFLENRGERNGRVARLGRIFSKH